MKLSTKAWNQSQDVFNDFIELTLNQKMGNGTLSEFSYANYLEQDYNFVVIESEFEVMIAKTITTLEYKKYFFHYSLSASNYAQEIEVFFEENKNISKTGIINSATEKYTDALLRSTVDKPIEVQVANFLPCVWYYRELGKYFAEHPYPDNPYQDYIDSLSDPQYIEDVDTAISIFDDLAEKSSLEVQDQMLYTFAKIAEYEVDFSGEAYKTEEDI